MFFPSSAPERTPSPVSSSASSSYSETPSSIDTACLPSFIAYKVRPQLVPHVHKALLKFVPSLGHAPCDIIQHMGRSSRYDTQVLFVTRDCAGTPLPHEAVFFSFGKGSKIQIYHTDKPIGAKSWFEWAESTAETLGLQKIQLPHTLFREDLGWMLRAHASRANGMQGHVGDTHLINRVERFFVDVVFHFRRQAWVQSNMPGISVRSVKQL